MDLQTLLFRLELAGFRDRESLAAQAARELSSDELTSLTSALRHAHANVRQGVMEVLAAAQHRAAIADLMRLAEEKSGDDRIFALRTVARLATPEDQHLRAAAEAFSRHADAFVKAQGEQLLKALGSGMTRALPTATTTPTPPAPPSSVDPAALLLAATSDAQRIKLALEIEALVPPSLVLAAAVVLKDGNADAVALMARVLVRQIARIPAEARADLVRLCEHARTRHPNAPVCKDALDACAMALGGSAVIGQMLGRVAELDAEHVESIIQQVTSQPADQLGELIPSLITAVQRHPASLPRLVPALLHVMPVLRPSWKADLGVVARAAALALPAEFPTPAPRDDVLKLERLAALLLHVLEPGDPTPARLFALADRLPAGPLHRTLMDLCVLLATEDAALRLRAMLTDPDSAMRRDALERAARFRSDHVQLTHPDAQPEVTARYQAPGGEVLSTSENRIHSAAGEAWVLDLKGRPVREKDTALGGCRCCLRPRALIRGLSPMLCPQTGEPHVTDGGKVLLQRNHPLGRCKRCETPRALVREGNRVVCPACRSIHSGGLLPLTPPPPSTSASPGSAPRSPDAPFLPTAEDWLPKAPSKADMQLVGHAMARAMACNVFLIGKLEEKQWNGSGIIVGREGNELAILTNRHILTDEDVPGVAAVHALTITGETVPLEPIWLASAGVDLALCVARVTNTEGIGVMEIGTGACLLGSPLFAVGNPLGLSWSYSSGTLAAFRRWNTQEGLELRFLQTQVPVGPGSSGGGLYHQEGHLVGVICFGIRGEAHFALSVESIRETLVRENVQWNGRALLEPLPPSDAGR